MVIGSNDLKILEITKHRGCNGQKPISNFFFFLFLFFDLHQNMTCRFAAGKNKDRMNKRPCKTPNPVILKIISDMKNNMLETALARMALGPEKDVDNNHSKLNSNPLANSANLEVHSRNQIINPYFKHCNLICYPNFCTDKDPCSLW